MGPGGDRAMDYGAHLPLIEFEDTDFTLDFLLKYTEVTERLGFAAVAANDHFVFPRPWLDGPTALAAVIPKTGRMQLVTAVALPVLRGPVPMAKTLSSLALLSGGRLVVGVGPGSSARDYAAVGIPFEERWKRLDECIRALRSLWGRDSAPFKGRFYSTEGIDLQPHSFEAHGPPIWIGSWGSEAGLRRVARLGDGWLASAYNTTPALFAAAWTKLKGWLNEVGKDPERFPKAIATMWTYITEDRAEADRILGDILAKMLGRSVDELRDRVLVGPAEECTQKLVAYRRAGAERIFIWPVRAPIRQLGIFMERVASLSRTATM